MDMRCSRPRGTNRHEHEDVVRQNLPLVHYAVAELFNRLPAHVSRDDLVSAGMFGLAQAAKSFDPGREVAFERYAAIRIKGALLDELRSRDWATRSVRAKGNALRSSTDALATRLGRTPEPREVAEELGVTPDELHSLVDDLHRATVLHAESVRTDGGAEELFAGFVDSAEDELVRRERYAYLFNAVEALPERLRRVVVGLFFEEFPMEELARELGVTESRISQLRAEAVGLLRDGLTANLEPEAMPETDVSPVVARRRAAYYAAIAGASDARSRLSIDVDAERTRVTRVASTA